MIEDWFETAAESTALPEFWAVAIIGERPKRDAVIAVRNFFRKRISSLEAYGMTMGLVDYMKVLKDFIAYL